MNPGKNCFICGREYDFQLSKYNDREAYISHVKCEGSGHLAIFSGEDNEPLILEDFQISGQGINFGPPYHIFINHCNKKTELVLRIDKGTQVRIDLGYQTADYFNLSSAEAFHAQCEKLALLS